MAKAKFPDLIHVTHEAGDDPYFLVHEDGVMGLEEPQPVAIYKLVKVGRVVIDKRFEDVGRPVLD